MTITAQQDEPVVVPKPSVARWQVPRTAGAASAVLFANLVWILLIIVAVTAGAGLYSWSRAPLYQSVATVIVQPRVYSSGSAPQAPDMGTEKALASSGAVLAMAAQSLHLNPDDLVPGLSVSVPAETHVLRIAYSHSDANEARRRAQALAESYVKQVSALSLPGTQPAGLVTAASQPLSPSSPDHALAIGMGLLVGLVLGVLFALVRDLFDDRLRSPADLVAHTGAPLLALLPATRRRGRPRGKLVVSATPRSPAAQSYRNLRTRIIQMAGSNRKTLLVTALAEEDSATISANLALATALAGVSVVLVSGNFANDRLPAFFGVSDKQGIAAVLTGELSLANGLRKTEDDRLLLLPAGPHSIDLDPALLSSALRQLLQELHSYADVVVVDGPPILKGPDAAILAELSDMVLLVADARHSKREAAAAAMRELAGTEHIACIMYNCGKPAKLKTRRASWA
jgi:polysaccharide biosynthesis transport protein